MPTLSIIIPAYNAEQYINHTIQSALSQTGIEVEVIVVDDASTDSTPEIARTYQHAGVRLAELPRNSGPAHARNHGISISNAPYLGFLDADDALLPDWASSLLPLLSAGAAIAVSDAHIVDADSEVTGRYYEELSFPAPESQAVAILRNNFVLSTCAVRREWLGSGFDTRYRGIEDWSLWLRIILAGGRVALADTVQSSYRRGHNSLSRDVERMLEMEVDLLSNLRAYPLSPELHRVRRQSQRIRRIRLAVESARLREGESTGDAIVALLSAVLKAPSLRGIAIAARYLASLSHASRHLDEGTPTELTKRGGSR